MRIALVVLFFGALLVFESAFGQAVSIPSEYGKKIEAANSLSALGSDSFGNSTNDATGMTVFDTVDIDVPGNNSLPVRLGRRLPMVPRYVQEELGGFGNWDIDVPYIDVTVSKLYGWSVAASNSPDRYKRCSIATEPKIEGTIFSASEVFHGYRAHIPGAEDGLLLVNGNNHGNPSDGQSYPWVFAKNGRVSCIQTIKNGQPGEGFVIHLADGTRYYFDYLVERAAPTLRKGPKYVQGYSMPRTRYFMLATKIEDRHGNNVIFNYSGNKLLSISGSDGRYISLQATSSGYVATAGGRQWQYVVENGYLTQVINPDGSKWIYSPFGTYSPRVDYDDIGYSLDYFSPGDQCAQVPTYDDYMGDATFNVTHPSGVRAKFEFSGKIFSRSKVPYYCAIDFFDHDVPLVSWLLIEHYQDVALRNAVMAYADCLDSGGSNCSFHDFLASEYEFVPDEQTVTISGHARIIESNTYPVFSLVSLETSGPGLPLLKTSYSYQIEGYPYCDIYDHETGLPVGPTCSEDPCPDAACTDSVGRWTEILKPNGEKIRKRYGVVYGVNEGALLEQQVLDSQGIIKRKVVYQYIDGSNGASQAFNKRLGWSLTSDPIEGLLMPLISTEIQQEGDTFTSAVPICSGVSTYCFDSNARPLRTTTSSSLFPAKTQVSEYEDNLSLWVMGQHKRGYNAETGVVDSEVLYNSAALPWKIYGFGKLQQTLTYNANGTLASVADGRENATVFSSWVRGIPQLITYADGKTQSVTVDTNTGWITSITDENGYVTGYGYDAMGRLASVVYPTGDTLAGGATTYHGTWANYRALTSADWKPAGVSDGQWRKLEGTGDHISVTYYDAMWRPVLTNEYDQNNVTPTLRSVRTEYDTSGRKSFESYPSSSGVPGSTGIRTFYDALDRVKRVEQDSELGILTTTTDYLSGLRTRVTNPRGKQTTTSFMAWDQPSYDLPILSEQPEGKVIQIARHPQFGWPLSMTQRNAANTLSQTRKYVYDGNAQLCKTIEPETGATVMGYDAAGNPAWSAAGLDAATFASTTDCQHTAAYASGRVSTRTYDTRNRLSVLDFPDHRGKQVWTYTPDGKPASITVYNAANDPQPVITAYNYNHRRLLTGETLTQQNWYSWTMGYAYDAYGNLASQTYPTGLTVAYAPNPLGQATQAGSYATGAQYYPNGALKQFTYGNGIVHTMTQNARQLPSQVTSSGTTNYTYNYDADGNITNIWDLARGENYSRWMTYDDLDRLTSAGSASFGGDAWHRFTYDALDNLASWKLAGVKDYAEYVYNAQNLLTNIRNTAGASVVGLGYDLQGNVNNKNGQTYDFDYGNRLRTVTGKESYRYDGLGRRVQSTATDGSKTTTWQYTQSGQMAFSSDWVAPGQSNQKTHENVYLAGSVVAIIDHDWPSNAVIATKYQHTDALGSPVAVTNAAGTVIERNDYEPYGAVIGKPTYSGIGYTGHVMDGGTGLTYMQQRYYDESIGRFLSIDPVTANGATGTNFNRYWYANNSPYRYRDPDGRESLGEIIDGYAMAAGAEERYGALYGWSFAAKAWDWFGAEGVSQVTNGNAPSAGDKVSAVLEVATLGKGGQVEKIGGKFLNAIKGMIRIGCSFDGETLVQTDHGLVAIDEIKIGDKVLAKNGITGIESYQSVLATISEWHQSTLIVSISSGGSDEAIITTDEHPFYVEGKGFISAERLKFGDVVRLAGGRSADIVGIRRNNSGGLAYNLTVANDHTYFVGRNRAWVHNSCPWKMIVENLNVSKMVDSMSPTMRTAYEKVVETLSRGKAGLNQHALKGERAGQFAIDLPGTGKGRGAMRVVYTEKDGVINIEEIVDYHKK